MGFLPFVPLHPTPLSLSLTPLSCHEDGLLMCIVSSRNFSISASLQVGWIFKLCHSLTCSWDRGRNVVKASGYYLVGIRVFFKIMLEWFLSPCSCEMGIQFSLSLLIERKQRRCHQSGVIFFISLLLRNGGVRNIWEG